MAEHDPVMIREIVSILELEPGATVVDGTIGLGGHSRELLKAIGPGGRLLGFDWDREMLEHARENLREKHGNETLFFHEDFREIPNILAALSAKADAIVLDLGLNSAQLEDSSRGIAFKTEGPLDMRMDRTRGEPASALVNRASPLQLESILFEFGDERWAKAIAQSIVQRRKEAPLTTTTDLVEAVLAAIPAGARDRRIHPATRTFQALRIAVNGELAGLEQAAENAAQVLNQSGIIAVLSYHSGEDRAIKQAFRKLVEQGDFTPVTKKPHTPSASEIARNPRSRSAKLRAIRRS